MKKQIWWIFLIVVIALLVSGVVLTQTALANRENARGGVYHLTALTSRETATGGVYHLTALIWQVSGSSGADGYHLQSYSQRALTGNGCCCVNLPCILKP